LACGAFLLFACGSVVPFGPSDLLTIQTEGVIVGAGDIGDCASPGTAATAALLDRVPGTVFTAGDNAYFHGSADDFHQCYEPMWGKHRARTHPSPGNHDYETSRGAPYYEYFGENAGPAGLGYYRFNVGEWIVLSLNSNVDAGPDSAQATWVRRELEELQPRCIAAVWHHPLFSSGAGGDPRMRQIWRILQDFGAEIVISAHDHFYERFTPMDADGMPNLRGPRSFIVGTGGAPLTTARVPRPGSEAWTSAWGVLKLTLRPSSYEWAFIPVPQAATAYDEGRGVCR
jgi:hypothetical protein